jgi:hypothetical protein
MFYDNTRLAVARILGDGTRRKRLVAPDRTRLRCPLARLDGRAGTWASSPVIQGFHFGA